MFVAMSNDTLLEIKTSKIWDQGLVCELQILSSNSGVIDCACKCNLRRFFKYILPLNKVCKLKVIKNT